MSLKPTAFIDDVAGYKAYIHDDAGLKFSRRTPDGEQAILPISRQFFCDIPAPAADDMRPVWGVADFSFVLWFEDTGANINPGSSFRDYFMVGFGNRRDTQAPVWGVSSGTQTALDVFLGDVGLRTPEIVEGWHMIVGTVNSSTGLGVAEARLYYDGALEDGPTVVTTSPTPSPSSKFTIGARNELGGTQQKTLIGCNFGPVSIFDRVLTLEEVQGLYGAMT